MTERGRLGVVALLLWVVATTATALEVPYLSGRVVDDAGMLSPEAISRINTRLEALETTTGAQVAVLTIPSLEDEVLEDYALRVAETWALGGADRDDGLLFLVAREERRMRMEVGYGLEGSVPDILAARVMDEIVQPRFRDGDFDGGIEAGVETLAGIIEGQAEALPSAPPAGSGGSGGMSLLTIVALFVLFIVVVNLLHRGGGGDSGRGGGGARRRGPPVVILPSGRKRGGGFGGFSGGGFSGGGFGGFSGGGGGFGGGGASGSW